MPSNGGSAGAPAGSASPDRAGCPTSGRAMPIQRSGVTAISSPSTTIVPDHAPTWANRWASSVTREPGAHHVRLLLDDRERAPPR